MCNDTSISHIAATLKTASLVIASGGDTHHWAPSDHPLDRVLADYPSCRPCMYRECPYGHPCALNISVAQVVQTARVQLAPTPGAESGAPNALHSDARLTEKIHHAA